MASIIERIFSVPWVYCITRFRRLWGALFNPIFRRLATSPYNLRPLTDQQRKQKTHEFIDSIDPSAIRALGSKYNDGLSCEIRCWCQGTFNVCYILDFPDGSTRLVRLPIEPAVHDVWNKVQSEVYTMQYVSPAYSISPFLRTDTVRIKVRARPHYYCCPSSICLRPQPTPTRYPGASSVHGPGLY